jgi:hypothetical protein
MIFRRTPTSSNTQYGRQSPIICPVLGFVDQICGNRIDLDQNVPEKLNWIELPATA